MTERSARLCSAAGRGRAIDRGGFSVSVKAATDDSDGAFSLLKADEPGGFGPPLHIHHDAAETFYVLAGEYIIYLESWSGRQPLALTRQGRHHVRESLNPRPAR